MLIVIYFSGYRSKVEMGKDLLCNDCCTWFQKKQLKFETVDKELLNSSFELGDFSILKKITTIQKYLRLTIYTCKNCKNPIVIDAVNIATELKRGDLTNYDLAETFSSGYTDKDISNLIITTESFYKIMDINIQNHRNSFLIFGV
jgi:hypothetical protein